MDKKLSLMHTESKNQFFEESRSIKQTIMSTDDNNLFNNLSMVSGNEEESQLGRATEKRKAERYSSDLVI